MNVTYPNRNSPEELKFIDNVVKKYGWKMVDMEALPNGMFNGIFENTFYDKLSFTKPIKQIMNNASSRIVVYESNIYSNDRLTVEAAQKIIDGAICNMFKFGSVPLTISIILSPAYLDENTPNRAHVNKIIVKYAKVDKTKCDFQKILAEVNASLPDSGKLFQFKKDISLKNRFGCIFELYELISIFVIICLVMFGIFLHFKHVREDKLEDINQTYQELISKEPNNCISK